MQGTGNIKNSKTKLTKQKKTQNIQIAFYNIMLSISHWHVCAFKTYDTLINLKQGICKKKKSENGTFM